MDKVSEAKKLLQDVGMPAQQQNDICAYALLTLANIKPKSKWAMATNEWIRIHDILAFAAEQYGKVYAENTRETIRKHCMHQFRDAALIEDNGKATNSPNYRYRLTAEAHALIKSYKTAAFRGRFKLYLTSHEKLVDKYASKKKRTKMAVLVNQNAMEFSPGEHNRLQKAILEEFAPRFAPNCECLYVGDTVKKDLHKDVEKLAVLGFEITLHDKMPDVVLYRADKDWLYFIEAVTSVGPMSPKRILELDAMTQNVTAGKIFVTAFPNVATYKKFAADLAWDTEVWLADRPEHMIHLNGDRFMGPR